MTKVEFATLQMTSTKLKQLAKNHKVQLVGDGRRGDVRKNWVALINAAIGVDQTKVRHVDFSEKRYYMLDELENYVAFSGGNNVGYAVFQADYTRYLYPDDYQFQKPVYKFVTGKGYAQMKSGLDKVIAALRKNAEADLRY